MPKAAPPLTPTAVSEPVSTMPKRSRRETLFILIGLISAIMLAMLDGMIVSTAMPTIVGELGGLAHLSWVVTSYTLAMTVSTPIWGKLSDIYGRKKMFLISITIFVVGSALSGAAQTMAQLIGFRGLQGLGAGGLIVGAIAIMGELAPPRERGRYMGLMMAAMPAAMIGGPLLGGFITDQLNWRWAFYVNVPLGVIALAIIGFTMRLPHRQYKARIDYLGAILLAVGIVSLVLVTTWGGTEFPWRSAQIVGLVILAIMALIAFILVERKVVDPIVPLTIFRNRNFVIAAILSFLAGFAMFSAVNYLPLYQQSVQGASATNSGFLLLPLMGVSLVVSIVTGQLMSRNGRYKIYLILGGAGLTIGSLLLSRLSLDTSHWTSMLFMIVLGLGMGFLMQTTMIIAQNSVEPRHLGAASGMGTFFRTIGGSLGLSLMGAVFANRLQESLTQQIGQSGADLTSTSGQLTPSKLDQLPAAVHDSYLQGLVSATQAVFWWTAVFMVAGFIAAWFLREIPLRGHEQSDSQPQSQATQEPEPAAAIA